MQRLRPRLTWLLPLALLGCDSNEPKDADSTAPLLKRLDETDARLTSIETKLDEATTKLDVVSTWVAEKREATKVEAERRAARRDEREAARAERSRRRQELGIETEDGTGGDLPPSSRAIPGAEAGIICDEESVDKVKCTLDKALLDSILDNPALLAKQARIVPSQKDGKTVGYKLYGIRRGTLPKLLMMKNGDMLTAINGNELRSIDRAMEIFTKLRTETHFEVEITRKGIPFDLEVDIVE